LEARVHISAGKDVHDLLERYIDYLRFIFIVSQVTLLKTEGTDTLVSVDRAEGEKCERCWNYSTHVGESSRYPTACERCVEALNEIEQEAA
jgi:isoleucyl-tRNA synthetase